MPTCMTLNLCYVYLYYVQAESTKGAFLVGCSSKATGNKRWGVYWPSQQRTTEGTQRSDPRWQGKPSRWCSSSRFRPFRPLNLHCQYSSYFPNIPYPANSQWRIPKDRHRHWCVEVLPAARSFKYQSDHLNINRKNVFPLSCSTT